MLRRATPVHKFNLHPINSVEYDLDIDYIGDGQKIHRLDVIVPKRTDVIAQPLPVYVYFHGGGWTSGDKDPLTKYCASQAAEGMIVINANYRMATRFQLGHMMQDGNAVLDWVARNVAAYGGDPTRIVLGGDSAGGHIAALITAAAYAPELAAHYGIRPRIAARHLRGLVQHCRLFGAVRPRFRVEPQLCADAAARARTRAAPAHRRTVHVANRMAGPGLSTGVRHDVRARLFLPR